jgi:hypothetical protein
LKAWSVEITVAALEMDPSTLEDTAKISPKNTKDMPRTSNSMEFAITHNGTFGLKIMPRNLSIDLKKAIQKGRQASLPSKGIFFKAEVNVTTLISHISSIFNCEASFKKKR